MRPKALLREEARKIWLNTRLAYWPTLSRRSHDVRLMATSSSTDNSYFFMVFAAQRAPQFCLWQMPM